MEIKSGFFNSINNDRLYSAIDFSSFFDGIFSDGVFRNYGDGFKIIPDSSQPGTVIVGSGKAWFNNTWSLLDAQKSMTLNNNKKCVATIALHINKSISIRNNSIDVVYSETISGIKIIDDDEWIVPLALVSIDPDKAIIEKTDIVNLVGTEACPYAAGILESDETLSKWTKSFDEWFNNIKNKLSSDTAGNLQNQIDALMLRHTSEITLSPNFKAYSEEQKPLLIRKGYVVELVGAVTNPSALSIGGNGKILIGTISESHAPIAMKRFEERGSMQNHFLLDVTPNGEIYMERHSCAGKWTDILPNSWLNISATWTAKHDLAIEHFPNFGDDLNAQ